MDEEKEFEIVGDIAELQAKAEEDTKKQDAADGQAAEPEQKEGGASPLNFVVPNLFQEM